MTDVVVGADLGGTYSRVVVADIGGTRLADVRAGGGNPLSNGQADAAAQFGAAVAGGLRGLDARAVRAVVVGLAGGLDDPATARLFADALAAAGLRAPIEYIGDAEIAFSSATPMPSGTVLLAGTGAAAAQIRDHRLGAVSDGLGWLLGDHGSGFWLGREAVRAALAALGGTGPMTCLAESVPRRLLGRGPAQRAAVVQAVAASGPVALAGLARLVAEAEAAGDAVAADICDRAAAHLAGAVADVRHPEDDSPLVLGGSVIAAPQSAVGKRVRAVLSARFAGDPIATADGTVGAVWLAIRHALPGATEQDLASVHRRLRH